jgi:chaperonin cofactor prefoldin
MPVSPNNLQFSLSSEYLDKLKSLSKDGESLGLTAKRILIEAFDGSIGGEAISKDDIQVLYEKIVKCSKRGLDTEDRIDRLESELKEEFTDTASAIKEVEDRIEAVEVAIDCQHYGDEVKELRGQVDELRKLIYQLTSPVKRR